MVRPIYHSPDQRRLVASAAHIAAKAAAAGDPVALEIYRNAGREIFRATDAVLKRLKAPFVGNVVTSGGVWKGHPVMREEFGKLLAEQWPGIPVRVPEMDPCVGGAVWRAVERGIPQEEYWPRITENFRDYRY